MTIWQKIKQNNYLIISFILIGLGIFLAFANGCHAMPDIAYGAQQVGDSVSKFAQNNPAINTATQGALGIVGSLIWAIGATIGLFVYSKNKNQKKDALNEIVNTHTIDKSKLTGITNEILAKAAIGK